MAATKYATTIAEEKFNVLVEWDTNSRMMEKHVLMSMNVALTMAVVNNSASMCPENGCVIVEQGIH